MSRAAPGLKKALLQAAGTALIAELGNGDGLNAALGAAASQLAANQVNEFADGLAGESSNDPVTREMVSNIISNAISGSIGLIAGGETGGEAASTMNRHNYQMHIDQTRNLQALRNRSAQEVLNDPTLTDEQKARIIYVMVEKYNAAACYLTDCAETVSTGDPMYAELKYWQDFGANCIEEQEALKATGLFNKKNFQFGFFEYIVDVISGATDDPNYQVPGWQASGGFSDFLTSKAEATERVMGGGQLAAGGVGVAGGAALVTGGGAGAAPSGGTSLVAVAAGSALITISANEAYEGSQRLTGDYNHYLGQALYDSFMLETYPGKLTTLADWALMWPPQPYWLERVR